MPADGTATVSPPGVAVENGRRPVPDRTRAVHARRHPADGIGAARHDANGRAAKTVLVCAVYTVLSFAVFHEVWTHDPRNVMLLGGDQFNWAWLLGWTPWAILHGHNPFFTDYLNYPFGVNLLTNPGITGLGVLFAPVALLFGAVAAFNTCLTLSLALSAIAGYFFVLRWVSWRPAAFLAGLLYGFSPYVLGGQVGELNLVFIAIPPLILLAVHDVVVRQHRSARRAGLTLGLLAVAQFFVSTEILLDTVIIGAIGVVTAAVIGHRSVAARVGYAARATAWAVGCAGLLLAYPVWFALAGPAHIKGKVQLIPQAYRSNLIDVAIPNSRSWLPPHHLGGVLSRFVVSPFGNGSYLGIPLLVLLAVGVVVLWRLPVVKVATICGLSAFVLALGNGLTVNGTPVASIAGVPLPGRILADLPVLDNIIPVRFAIFQILCAALLAAVILDRARTRMRSRGDGPAWLATVLMSILGVVVLVPLIPAPVAGIGPTAVPSFFSSPTFDRLPVGSAAVVFPMPSNSAVGATLWQAVTERRYRQPGTTLLVPGPDGTEAYSAALGGARTTVTSTVLISTQQGTIPQETPALRRALLGEWRSWKVRTFVAVIPGTPQPAQELAFFTWLLGRPPSWTDGTTYCWFGLPTG